MQAPTGIPWLDAALAVLSAWGYAAVFIGGMLENLFLVGGFMPGETIVMAVAFLASQDPDLNIVLVWVVSVLGTTAGSNLSYAIGRFGGRPLIVRILRRWPKMLEGLDRAEHYFEMHGSYTVVIARFTAGFKNFVPTLAGVAHMNLWVFEAYTLLGAALYSVILCVLGYKFGEYLDVIIYWGKKAGLWVMLAIVVIIGGYVVYRVWRWRSIERQVEGHVAVEEALEAEEARDLAEDESSGAS